MGGDGPTRPGVELAGERKGVVLRSGIALTADSEGMRPMLGAGNESRGAAACAHDGVRCGSAAIGLL
eukprot:570787-Prymnesium_polylepis.1